VTTNIELRGYADPGRVGGGIRTDLGRRRRRSAA